MSHLIAYRCDRKAIGLSQRAMFTEHATRLATALARVAIARDEDLVILDTCERFEVYATSASRRVMHAVRSSGDGLPFGDQMQGVDALRHLFRVASGLDSRLVGEPHILGQIRAALDASSRRGTVSIVLGDAFSYAIRCGRRVRRLTTLGTLARSYTERAVEALVARCDDLRMAAVTIVGTGSLAVELAITLRKAGVGAITLVGRHEQKLAALAHDLNTSWQTLASFQDRPAPCGAIITALAAAAPVVDHRTVARTGAKTVIDLGAAPNVTTGVRQLANVMTLGLDELGPGTPQTDAVQSAESIVHDEVLRYVALREASRSQTSRRRAS